MKITLTRKYFSDITTIGTFQLDKGFSCFALEDKDRKLEADGVKIPKETCIPRGTYKVIIDFSNRFQTDMPHVLDVPQFEGIRIHSGNTQHNTAGCILLGGSKGIDFINNSKVTFGQFMVLLRDALGKNESVSIDIL